MSPQIREIFNSLIIRKTVREIEIRNKIDQQIEEAEAAEAEKARIAAEEEEERKRAETEGAEGEAAAKKEEGPKVERPEPATERVPAKEPGVVNIDNDFKPTVLKVWEELSDTYKQQMKRVFRQVKYINDFSDQFPDLREDEATKDELHQRVDTLSDELWEIIEERKEQHIEERKKIMESGWVEHELAFMV